MKKVFKGCALFVFAFFIIVSLFIFGSIYFYTNGIPAVSNFIVNKLDKSIDHKMGKEIRIELLKRAPIHESKSQMLSLFYQKLGYDTKTKIYVISDKNFNALAIPDNSIFVMDEVINQVASYPELAALLGHEYAHIYQRHGIKQFFIENSRELVEYILSGGGSTGGLVNGANRLLILKNSRDFELEADILAIKFMRENSIYANGMLDLLNRMENIEANADGQEISYLSTHPSISDRIENAKKELAKTNIEFENNLELEQIFQDLKSLE